MTAYVALLRGINVGGKNIIKMADLRACFEEHGYDDVATYIQSGNVVFGKRGARAADLTRAIEEMLAARFSYEATVMLLSRPQLKKIVSSAPAGFGEEPELYRYDVIFLQAGLTPKAALANVATNPNVDTAHAGPGALYFSRLISKASKSRLSKLASKPVYQRMTIRNWNTTTKLLSMMS
jgi:uncharacterized protein (DUF1697 family)